MVYGAMQGSSSETDHHPAHLKLLDEAQGNKLNVVNTSLPAWRNPGPLEANFPITKREKTSHTCPLRHFCCLKQIVVDFLQKGAV